MSITRRDFVKTAGASGAALSLTAGAAAAIPAPAAGPVQNEDIWIDALGGLRLGEKGHDEIRRAGLTMIETTLGSAGNPTFGYERAVQDVARWHRNFADNPDHIIHVRTVKDIHEAKRTGKLAVMIGFQNATQLARDIRNVDFFYNLGIRQIQLTYNSLNALGAGCTERKDVGLSYFGVEVVKKMNELGMLVDLSHVGYQTTMDAIEVSEKPPIFSHTNCRALTDNPRCKRDDQIRALAARGGVMGVTTVNFFVSKKTRSTLDDYINHIVHVADLVGVDHVGIGTDSSIGGWRVSFPTEKVFWDFHEQFHFHPDVDVRWPPFIEELDNPETMHTIANELTKRGFNSDDVRKVMGANFMRVYEQVLI